jgi:Holliday junction DNA helicase RuvA
MIAFLSGKPSRLGIDSLIIEVNGVGYKVFVPQKNILTQATKTEKLDLFIHSHIREDSFDLFGFVTREELSLFELIISISGIGPKIGLSLLNQGVAEITQAVSRADVDFFTAIPRLGRKNAQKLIIELKPKLGDLKELDLNAESGSLSPAISALLSLGFSRKEASEALRGLPAGLALETRVTEGLKNLGSKKIK